MPSIKRKKLITLPLPPLSSALAPILVPHPHRRTTKHADESVATDEELLDLAGGAPASVSGKPKGSKARSQKAAVAPPPDSSTERSVIVGALEEGREPTEEELVEFYRHVGGVGFRSLKEHRRPTSGVNGETGTGDLGNVTTVDGHAVNAIAGPSNATSPARPSKAHLSFLLDEGHSAVSAAHGGGKAKPDVKEPEVYMIKETGEVFLTYDAYIQRVMFYRAPVFTCEISGKNDLSYFQALASEEADAVSVHRSFPEAMKEPILHAVQFQTEGRLDEMVDKLTERVKDRFFVNEKLYVEVGGEKLLCNIIQVIPPTGAASTSKRANGKEPASSTSSRRASAASPSGLPVHWPHALGLDISISAEDAIERDDPAQYEYVVQLITAEDLQRNPSVTDRNFSGPEIRVGPSALIREKTHFHKVMMRKYLRECLVRDVAIGSPWYVKAELAQRYHIPTEMPEHIRERVAAVRQEMLSKRKKPKLEETEDEEEEDEIGKGPNKRQKLSDGKANKEDAKAKSKEARQRAKERKAEEDRIRKEQEAAEKAEEEKRKKRKPTKFPAEDLLIEMTDREREAGMVVQRPVPGRHMPFAGDFDQFLAAWTFLNGMSAPLALQPFTIDEFEQSLYHSDIHTPCVLLNETHAALLNVLIREAQAGLPEVFPLKAFGPLGRAESTEMSDEEQEDPAEENGEGEANEIEDGNDVDEEDEKVLYGTANDLAMKWTERELSAKDGRKGWENALVGCLWSRSITKTLPNLVNFVKGILWEGDAPAPTNRPTWKAVATRPKLTKRPDQRYLALHSKFKLEILLFLIELVMQTKHIKDAMDESSTALSKCRNDQNEAKREYKRIHEDLDALEPKDENGTVNGHEPEAATGGLPPGAPPRVSAEPSINGTGTDRDELDESRMSPSTDDDVDMSDVASDVASGSGGMGRANGRSSKISGAAARQKALMERKLAQDAENAAKAKVIAQQREEARLKKAEGKTLSLEKKRLQDEFAAVQARLVELDREFRSQASMLRSAPIGRDRFGNKYWWLDGTGTAPLVDKDSSVIYGTGRIYLQGGSPEDLERRAQEYDFTADELQQKRLTAEGEDGILEEGEWAVFDTPEQLEHFYLWLQPRGTLEAKLHKFLKSWWYAVDGGLKKRVALLAPADANVDSDLPNRRSRVGRAAALSHRGKESYLSYRNKLG